MTTTHSRPVDWLGGSSNRPSDVRAARHQHVASRRPGRAGRRPAPRGSIRRRAVEGARPPRPSRWRPPAGAGCNARSPPRSEGPSRDRTAATYDSSLRLGRPYVSVPVLSRIMVRQSVSCSSAAGSFTMIPASRGGGDGADDRHRNRDEQRTRRRDHDDAQETGSDRRSHHQASRSERQRQRRVPRAELIADAAQASGAAARPPA